jgi:hypothetical protein
MLFGWTGIPNLSDIASVQYNVRIINNNIFEFPTWVLRGLYKTIIAFVVHYKNLIKSAILYSE